MLMRLTSRSFWKSCTMKIMSLLMQVWPLLAATRSLLCCEHSYNNGWCAEILEYAKWLGMDTENEKV